jgi:steroid delta-isomerase
MRTTTCAELTSRRNPGVERGLRAGVADPRWHGRDVGERKDAAMNYGKAVTAAEAYLKAIEGDEPQQVVDLFADEFTWEDPVGAEPLSDKNVLLQRYATAAGKIRVVRRGPIRGSHSDAAAVPFEFELQLDGSDRPKRVRVVDVFTVNDEGLITSMKAYWSPEDIQDI